MTLDGTDLQLIRLDDGRVVLSRGIAKVLLGGEGADAVAETLVALLDGTRERAEIVDAFPGRLRSEVDRILGMLIERRLVGLDESAEPDGDVLQSSFYASFGSGAGRAHAELASANVVVYGVNLIARSLARSLLELGIGSLTLVGHPVLSDEFAAARLEELDGGPDAPTGMRVVDREPDLDGVSLVCATSDLGEPEALADLNRLALREERLFLPAWVADLIGYVGPLVYPFETACFRCYRLRADSNDPTYAVSRQIRRQVTEEPVGRASSGLLPPMAAVVGEIAAIEVVKALTQFAPSDAVGRLIEINLVSFGSLVRRVLKVPRCPDCSDAARRPTLVLEHGPQIPFPGH
jgi:bacteriocin biosynthesis cyclodehydratase domain-containing protein